MDFLSESNVLIYFFIFFGKILEVTISTLRLVLINRGEKIKGSIIAVFDIIIWLFITGTVLEGFQDDILRVIVFALAFAVGNYMGSWLEEKLAFGMCSIQVIVSDGEKSAGLAGILRENNFAVTILEGKGKDGPRQIMYLHLTRKRIPQAIEIIKSRIENAVIVVNDVKAVRGGFIKK
ncbi:DUF2179 domain-containing protein [Mobilitalea sibirica]|uniref:DUF2179 domain-containing protein n=1 Tax=Mobilitalea sibirica TaxID=1462919 RepID=A0A8J7H134_9FIRM|nr:DUF5698 domain-containing protein [Mobilitalea sibirica]MBH1942339.1 DUF2179 domain-containing protein [Mobilitalea sibirica]